MRDLAGDSSMDHRAPTYPSSPISHLVNFVCCNLSHFHLSLYSKLGRSLSHRQWTTTMFAILRGPYPPTQLKGMSHWLCNSTVVYLLLEAVASA